MVTRGYSEKIRVLICRSQTYDLPITSSDTLPLSYRGLVGDGGSAIFGKNPSAPLKESNLRPSDFLFADTLPLGYRRLVGDGGSVIFGKNRSAPLQESNLRPSDYLFGNSTTEL